VTTASDLTGIIPLGSRIKLTQTTVKYFIVTAIDATTMTLYGGTDYTLANASISSPSYSLMKAPLGFPISPAKWTVEVLNSSSVSQSSPTSGTWYNVSSISISVPIGLWRLQYEVTVNVTRAVNGGVSGKATLSTANNTESDATMTTGIYATNSAQLVASLSRERIVTLAAKTSYFMNAKTTDASITGIGWSGPDGNTMLRATCAYL
jgi:hypothetical protein